MKNNSMLYVQIKENLLEEIKLLAPNDRIPSRPELVKKYGVTRTTIDRAISELIGEGVLYSLDGSGTYVTENKRKIVPNWCVILPNIMSDTYPGILRGVEDVANNNDIATIICNTDNNVEKQSNYIYKQIELGVKGFVIVPAISDNNDIAPFKLLKEKNIPFVFCNRSIPEIDTPKVISNNFYGGYIVTKHLIENGYKNIAYVSRPIYSTSSERFQGYSSAIKEACLELEKELVIFEDSFEEKRPGYESTKLLLSKNIALDAIFCFNDAIARGAYDAITEAGLTIGKDIGLAGYDNTSLCDMLPVKLTSVRFKTYETGIKAAETLLKMTNGENLTLNDMIVLQPELVIRESSQKTIL